MRKDFQPPQNRFVPPVNQNETRIQQKPQFTPNTSEAAYHQPNKQEQKALERKLSSDMGFETIGIEF